MKIQDSFPLRFSVKSVYTLLFCFVGMKYVQHIVFYIILLVEKLCTKGRCNITCGIWLNESSRNQRLSTYVCECSCVLTICADIRMTFPPQLENIEWAVCWQHVLLWIVVDLGVHITCLVGSSTECLLVSNAVQSEFFIIITTCKYKVVPGVFRHRMNSPIFVLYILHLYCKPNSY